MEPRYLSEAGELEESSGTEGRGVHQALRVSNQLKAMVSQAPMVGTVESRQRHQMHLV